MDRIGRYQISKELGRGAMGVVYLAVDPTIGRNVAIKTIRLGEVTDPEERAKLRERLFREARSAGILSHPGIVTIYDMEEHDEVAFIAMEFVDGPTLDQLLSKRETLAAERLMSILRQTAAALDYAHAKGIVHRDIKPANIMIADGTVKITDFGIAKVTTSQQYTQTGTILGTPNYMSPEQVQGLAVTGRADQFSLAVIAFEMLTGDRPFTGEHLTTVVYKIVAEEPPPVQRLNPTLGPQIDGALRRGLSKKPEGRYNSCIEFVNGLDAACANTQGWKNLPRGGNLNLPTVISEMPAGATAFRPGSTTEEVVARRRSRWKWVLPFVAALVVALGLIGLIALQFGDLGTTKSAAPAAPTESGSTSPPAQTASNPPPAETPAPSAVEEKKPSPMEAAPVSHPPSETADNPPQTSPVEQKKPVAAEPAATQEQEQQAPPVQERQAPPEKPKAKVRPAKGPQDETITSEPAGATAVLDGDPSTSCKTPCVLKVMPGRHTVTISQPGYQQERREIPIIDSPVDVPMITLRAQTGTLMLTSDPVGAAIFLNDQPTSKTTPAQINLPPGTYTVRLEKNGVQKSKSIEIRNGETTFQKIPLQ